MTNDETACGRARTSIIRRSSIVVRHSLLFAAVFLAACGGPKKQPPTLVDAVNDFRAGRYDSAYEVSSKLANAPNATDQSVYMAGMTAYRLKKHDEAMRHLGKLTDSKDDSIAGPANATIALILAERGNHDRALAYFQAAVPKLKGNDQAQAYYNMAISEQKLGKWAEALPHLTLAAANATSPDLKAAAQHRMRTAGFTLQFGAYKVQKTAEKLARDVSPVTEHAGIGTARVVAVNTGGQSLYHVQAGTFSSHEAALNAKKRLNRPEVSVEQLGQ